MKVDLKRMSSAICGPGKKGSCTPSDNSRGAFGRNNKRMKGDEYKAGKTPKMSKKEQKESDLEAERIISGRKGKEVAVWHREWDDDEEIPERLKSGYKLKEMGVKTPVGLYKKK
jgi:hypothetical protein